MEKTYHKVAIGLLLEAFLHGRPSSYSSFTVKPLQEISVDTDCLVRRFLNAAVEKTSRESASRFQGAEPSALPEPYGMAHAGGFGSDADR
jgi:hypothetical protein